MTALVSHGPEETPGPLDPYIRKALERSALGSGPESLPTRSVFLAAVIMEFTERMTDEAELAELTADPGGEAGDLVVAGQVARFVDEVCGNGARLQWPFPWPEPRWYPDVLTGADLTVMGTQFQECAALAMDRDLGRTFADAAQALLEAGAIRQA